MKQYVPARDFLLVNQNEAEEKSSSGLYVPGEQQKKPSEGVVVTVGPECKELKPGDHIRYNKGAGVPIEEDKSLVLIREDDYLYKIVSDEDSSPE